MDCLYGPGEMPVRTFPKFYIFLDFMPMLGATHKNVKYIYVYSHLRLRPPPCHKMFMMSSKNQ